MEVYQWASLVVSVLSLFGVGTVLKIFWENKIKEKQEKTKEAQERIKKQKQDEMREVMKEETQFILEKMDSLHSNDSIKREALQAILRDRLY